MSRHHTVIQCRVVGGESVGDPERMVVVLIVPPLHHAAPNLPLWCGLAPRFVHTRSVHTCHLPQKKDCELPHVQVFSNYSRFPSNLKSLRFDR